MRLRATTSRSSPWAACSSSRHSSLSRERTRHTHTLLFITCHLGLAAFERRIQLRRVLNDATLRRTHKATPVIIAGDYNDVWGNLGPQIMNPADFRSVSGFAKTFPAVLPMRPLDRIFYRGDIRVEHSFVSRTQIARQASDHLPLVARFVLES